MWILIWIYRVFKKLVCILAGNAPVRLWSFDLWLLADKISTKIACWLKLINFDVFENPKHLPLPAPSLTLLNLCVTIVNRLNKSLKLHPPPPFESFASLFDSFSLKVNFFLSCYTVAQWWDRRVVSLRLTRGTVVCPWSRHLFSAKYCFNFGKHPDMTEKLLTGM